MIGPRSVIQGTGVILDGSLICVDCVKGGASRRAKAPVVSKKALLIAGGALVAVLGLVAIFLPGQVLMITLLLALAAVLVGAIGFTLTSVARLACVAVGLTVLAGSVAGLVVLRQRTEGRAVQAEMGVQGTEIKAFLDADCVVEARMRIGTMEENERRRSQGNLTKATEDGIADLRKLVDEWVKKSFGQLSPDEQNLLFDIYQKTGSLTLTSKTRTIRALKLTGNTLQLEIAFDAPTKHAEDDSKGPHSHQEDAKLYSGQTGDGIQEEARRDYQLVLRKRPKLESIELKLISGGKDGAELYFDTLNAEEIKSLSRGDLTILKRGAKVKTAQ